LLPSPNKIEPPNIKFLKISKLEWISYRVREFVNVDSIRNISFVIRFIVSTGEASVYLPFSFNAYLLIHTSDAKASSEK